MTACPRNPPLTHAAAIDRKGSFTVGPETGDRHGAQGNGHQNADALCHWRNRSRAAHALLSRARILSLVRQPSFWRPLLRYLVRHLFSAKARHCDLRCRSLLTDRTPGTPRVTASAFWICTSESTYPDNCTTPRYVATLIGNALNPGSATSARCTRTASAASSVAISRSAVADGVAVDLQPMVKTNAGNASAATISNRLLMYGAFRMSVMTLNWCIRQGPRHEGDLNAQRIAGTFRRYTTSTKWFSWPLPSAQASGVSARKESRSVRIRRQTLFLSKASTAVQSA